MSRTFSDLIVTNNITALGATVNDFVATAKGDLITTIDGSLLSPLAVGLDGYILSANSTSLTGLEWIKPAVSPIVDLVTTIDSTPTVISSIATVSGGAYLIDSRVIGKTSENSVGIKLNAFFQNVGGVLTKLGTDDTLKFGSQSWSVAASASGTNILITVTGQAATSIDWSNTYLL